MGKRSCSEKNQQYINRTVNDINVMVKAKKIECSDMNVIKFSTTKYTMELNLDSQKLPAT